MVNQNILSLSYHIFAGLNVSKPNLSSGYLRFSVDMARVSGTSQLREINMSNTLFNKHMSYLSAVNDPRYFSLANRNYGNSRKIFYPHSQTGQPSTVLQTAFLPGMVLTSANLPVTPLQVPVLPSPVLRSPVLPSSDPTSSFLNGYPMPVASQVNISANNLNKILIAILLLVSLDLVFVRPSRSLPSAASQH